MMHGKICGVLIGALLASSLAGCTGQVVQTATGPMPDYCTTGTPNTASGAIIGSLLGAAIGAAAGGGRGAALGAAIGGAGGAMTGAQMDATCQQYAMQNFMQMMAQQAAAQRAAMAQGQQVSQAQDVVFDYYSPAAGSDKPAVRHQIRQTSHYADPATGELCGGYSNLSFGADGKSTAVAGAGKICTGADGKPHAA